MSYLQTSIYYPRAIGLFANGVFTGVGLCMNFVSVPSIKASKDPLPVFRQTYGQGSKLGIASIVISTVANAVCYHRTKDSRFIYSTLLSFISFPFTLLFLRPVNNQLFAQASEGENYDRKKTYGLVAKWNSLQYVRTIAGTAAFVINVLYRY